MKSKILGLAAVFSLAGCQQLEAVARQCSGPAGTAKMVRENPLAHDFILIHTTKDGTVKKYTLDKLSPFAQDEILLGVNAVDITCQQGKPDTRWSPKPD